MVLYLFIFMCLKKYFMPKRLFPRVNCYVFDLFSLEPIRVSWLSRGFSERIQCVH